MICPKCRAEEGFVEVEFHGVKAKACRCGALMITEIADEYAAYLEEEQLCKREEVESAAAECPEYYFCF